jgi:thiamine-monophosphate kinase
MSDKSWTPPGHTSLRSGAEFDLVRRMLSRWQSTAQGVGDDAAIISHSASGSIVVSTDVSVENVHFRRGWLEPKEIGYRATAAALSDLAAMGAEPLGVLIALTLPEGWRGALDALADGIGEAAEGSHAPIVGGDLSEGSELALAVTVLGKAEVPLRRSGAEVGHRVYVTGKLGAPGAALSSLLAGESPVAEHRSRFAHPVPRIPEARWLANHGVSSAIDISDGLVADLSQIATASGVGISIMLDRVPLVSGVSARDAVGSGEEYELAVTSPRPLDTAAFEKEFGLELTEIGAVEAGEPVVRVFDHGAPTPTPTGYLHFVR